MYGISKQFSIIFHYFQNRILFSSALRGFAGFNFFKDFNPLLQFQKKWTRFKRNSRIIIRLEYLHWTLDNLRQNIDLCPTKAASQRTQLSGGKLGKFLISISLPCSAFLFYEHFNRLSNYAVIFYIQNSKMYLSKNILYQHFAFLYVIT